ncbi:hypothetical protein TYRP_014321 [Tyrophagus putrescentiae]|nr:hypothetical protein TYRP_014321 [Tyrophagus putrescentiae]
MGGLHGFRLTISAGIISCCTWKTLNEQQEHGRVVLYLLQTDTVQLSEERAISMGVIKPNLEKADKSDIAK